MVYLMRAEGKSVATAVVLVVVVVVLVIVVVIVIVRPVATSVVVEVVSVVLVVVGSRSSRTRSALFLPPRRVCARGICSGRGVPFPRPPRAVAVEVVVLVVLVPSLQ